MQRITDEMARNMLRQMAEYDDHVASCACNLHAAEGNDSFDVELWRAAHEAAKTYASIWREGMRALGVEPVEDAGRVSGAMVRRDGGADFVALD